MRLHAGRVIAALIFIVYSPATVFGQDNSTAKPFYFSVNLGLQNPSLGDVNDYLSSNEDIFESSSGINVNWDEFSTVVIFGGEIGKRVSKTASLGVRASYQSQKINSSFSNAIGTISYDPEYQLVDISARIKFTLPDKPQLYLGFSGGFASAKFTEYMAGRFPSDPQSNLTLETEFTGAGVSFGGFGGYQVDVGSSFVLQAEVGYTYCNLGSFDGYADSPEFGHYEGPALDNSGQEMDFDFSGFGIRVGGVVFLGR